MERLYTYGQVINTRSGHTNERNMSVYICLCNYHNPPCKMKVCTQKMFNPRKKLQDILQKLQATFLKVIASFKEAFFCYGICPQATLDSKGLRSKPLAGPRHALSIDTSYHQQIIAELCSVIILFVIDRFINNNIVFGMILPINLSGFFQLDPIQICPHKCLFHSPVDLALYQLRLCQFASLSLCFVIKSFCVHTAYLIHPLNSV